MTRFVSFLFAIGMFAALVVSTRVEAQEMFIQTATGHVLDRAAYVGESCLAGDATCITLKNDTSEQVPIEIVALSAPHSSATALIVVSGRNLQCVAASERLCVPVLLPNQTAAVKFSQFIPRGSLVEVVYRRFMPVGWNVHYRPLAEVPNLAALMYGEWALPAAPDQALRRVRVQYPTSNFANFRKGRDL